MLRQIIPVLAVAAAFSAGSALAGDPIRSSINAAYRYDRRAVNHDFERHEDAIRDEYRAMRDREEADWKYTRKHVSSHERKVIDQQYHNRRKALHRQLDAELDALKREEDRARDAMQDDYRRSLRGYDVRPRYEYPAPRSVPYENVPYEDNYRGPVYDDRSVVPSQPQYYEPLPVPTPTAVRPRDIVLGILNDVLR